MVASRRNLRVVAGTGRPPQPEHRCSIAASVTLAGRQDVAVRGVTQTADPRGHGHIAVRVGRVLIYLEDRDAFEALQEAVRRAAELTRPVFAPLDPPQALRRR